MASSGRKRHMHFRHFHEVSEVPHTVSSASDVDAAASLSP